MLEFKTIATGSSGNCYYLNDVDTQQKLILDVGIPINQILKGIEYDIVKLQGTCISHEHQDHSLSADKIKRYGSKILKPYEDGILKATFGMYDIQAFELPHDGVKNYGFYIKVNDKAKVLYMTDFEYCSYKFIKQEINTLIIECNYQEDYLDKQAENYKHKVLGHCSYETLKDFVLLNQTKSLRNVILIHYSDETCNIKECANNLQKLTDKNVKVWIAKPNETIRLRGIK